MIWQHTNIDFFLAKINIDIYSKYIFIIDILKVTIKSKKEGSSTGTKEYQRKFGL